MTTEGTSKNGTPYVIRPIARTDLQSAWEYINELSKEQTFVSLQGEEVTLEEEEKVIDGWVNGSEKGTTVALALMVENRVRGICTAQLEKRTESHIAWMGLAISADVRGEGLGRIFFQATIDESIRSLEGLKILALEVKAPNDLAQSLYKSCGFIEFGRLPLGTIHRGKHEDQIFMYKPIVEA